nr:hypothetical protein [uncultured Bifidobacterium sp.]
MAVTATNTTVRTAMTRFQNKSLSEASRNTDAKAYPTAGKIIQLNSGKQL